MRHFFALAAVALVSLVVLAGCSQSEDGDDGPTGSVTQSSSVNGASCVASPTMTIGPYYLDAAQRMDVRTDTDDAGGLADAQADDVGEAHEEAGEESAEDEANEPPWAEFIEAVPERSAILLDAAGTPQPGALLRLTITVNELVDGVCSPMAGAKVDIWHANAQGKYSGFAQEGTTGEDWLRGWQTSDDQGKVTFDTIWPGWYRGRAVHIHVRVREAGTDFISQFFFDEAMSKAVFQGTAAYTANGKSSTADTPNARDGIFGQGGDKMIVLTAGQDGTYTGTKTIVVAD